MAKNDTTSMSDDPIYTERRPRGNGSDGRSLAILLILLLIIATGSASWLYFDQISKNADLRQEVINISQSMSIIREALQITDESITDQYEQRNKTLINLQKEINKLWTLTNKKQKSQIQKLVSKASSNASAIKKIDQSSDQLRRNVYTLQENIDSLSADVSQELGKIADLLTTMQNDSLTEEVQANSKTLTSLKNSRAALNSRIAKLQQEVSLIKNKILVLENNQPIPSYDLEKTAQ